MTQQPQCPVIHLTTGVERPYGEWISEWGERREASPIYWNEHPGYWVLTRAEHVREVLQNAAVFRSDSIVAGEPDQPFKWIPGNINPPTHVQYRQILNRAFGPMAVAAIEPKAAEYCRKAVDDVVGRGAVEFQRDVAGVFSAGVFLEVINQPPEKAVRFAELADQIFDGIFGLDGYGMTDVIAAMAEIRVYFEEQIEQRRRHPMESREDFLSFLMSSSISGEPISDDDVLNICNQLVLAGLDTVKSQLGYSMRHLATHDADRRRLLAEPELIPSAIEEFLRAYPLIQIGRKIGEDIDFHGWPMKKGQMVMMTFPAAMRDPRAFAQADSVLLDRTNNNHMAFGAGPHRCLGAHLARMEMRLMLKEWHRRIPEYRLDVSDGQLMERGGQLSLRSLPLAWDN